MRSGLVLLCSVVGFATLRGGDGLVSDCRAAARGPSRAGSVMIKGSGGSAPFPAASAAPRRLTVAASLVDADSRLDSKEEDEDSRRRLEATLTPANGIEDLHVGIVTSDLGHAARNGQAIETNGFKDPHDHDRLALEESVVASQTALDAANTNLGTTSAASPPSSTQTAPATKATGSATLTASSSSSSSSGAALTVPPRSLPPPPTTPPSAHALNGHEVSRIRRAWRRTSKLTRTTRRSLRIWRSACSFAVRVAVLRRRFVDKDSQAAVEARRSLAAELRDTLLDLGPTFIKFGQLLSTRVDALQPEVIRELQSLQNDVPGFSPDRAMSIVKQELGVGDLSEVFASFEREPMAAASLAQVHRATLLDGTDVIVKVQREGLTDILKVDFANIRFLATFADRLDPENEGVSSNWKGIAETSEGVLWRELDFGHEREAADKFRAAFEEGAVDETSKTKLRSKPLPYVKVPRTYPDLCTSKILVLEYVPGTKISDVEALEKMEGVDMATVAARLTTSYLEQLCRHGFFHCDPHPGNVAVDDKYPGGRIVYYDFGMMETIETDVKKGFVDLVYALYRNAPILACDALEAMGVLRKGLDRYSIERIATNYLNTFASTIDSKNAEGTLGDAQVKWENEMTEEEQFAERRRRRAKIGADLFATQADRPFVFPPKFTFVFRAITTIDGIGKNLDPSYDLTRLSSPYLRELSDLRDGSALKTALLELGERVGLRPVDLAAVVKQPRNVDKVKNAITRIEDGELKLRVRSLEVERMLERVEVRQRFYGCSALAVFLWRQALDTQILAGGLLRRSASGCVGLAALILSVDALRACAKLQKLDRNRRRFETNEL